MSIPAPPDKEFQSTLSLRRATNHRREPCGDPPISIHALLAESDRTERRQLLTRRYFNPRSPCGERQSDLCNANSFSELFQSTLSLRRATDSASSYHGKWWISIHALLAESDVGFPNAALRSEGFQSTLSLRRATREGGVQIPTAIDFNPRSPCGERPVEASILRGGTVISIHALLAESDIKSLALVFISVNFNPRSPCGERP